MAWDEGVILDDAPWERLSEKVKALCGTAGAETWELLERVPAGTGEGQSGSDAYAVDVFRCNGTNLKYRPVSHVNLLNAGNTTDATSFAFAGVGAMSANRFYTIAIHNTKASNANTPVSVTLDGANAPTFTKVADAEGVHASNILRASVWIGKSGANAPTGTTLTVNFGAGNTQTACLVIMDEWTGLDLSLGTTGVDATGATQIAVQVGGGAGTGTTSHSGELAAPCLGRKSVVYSAAGCTATTGTYTQPAGWWRTNGTTASVATPNIRGKAAMRIDNEETSMTWTHSTTTSLTSWIVVLIELQRGTFETEFEHLNDAGQDWYFMIEQPVGLTGNYCLNAGERYDAGYKYFSSMIASPAATAVPVGSGYWRSIHFTNYSNVEGNGRTTTLAGTVITTGFNYWIKMARNGVVIATRGAGTEYTVGFMLIDSLVTGIPDPVPLISIRSATTAGNIGAAFTNLPGVTVSPGTTTTGWQLLTTGWTTPLVSPTTSQAAGAQDLWADSKVHIGRIFVAHSGGNSSGTGGAADRGYARGLIKSDFLGMSQGGNVQYGDTMTIDGDTWKVISNGFHGSTGTQALIILTRPV